MRESFGNAFLGLMGSWVHDGLKGMGLLRLRGLVGGETMHTKTAFVAKSVNFKTRLDAQFDLKSIGSFV